MLLLDVVILVYTMIYNLFYYRGNKLESESYWNRYCNLLTTLNNNELLILKQNPPKVPSSQLVNLPTACSSSSIPLSLVSASSALSIALFSSSSCCHYSFFMYLHYNYSWPWKKPWGRLKMMKLTWGTAERETKDVISWRKRNGYIFLNG